QAENVSMQLPSIEDQLADCVRLVDAYGPRRVWLAPGATWALEVSSLQAARRLATDRGVRISLHTDEVLFDSQESLRRFGLRTVPDALRLATSGGAAALGRDDFGTLEVGKRADLFVFDPLHAKSIPVHDPVSTLVYSSGQANVRTTVVGGQVVLDDRRIVGVDEAGLLRDA